MQRQNQRTGFADAQTRTHVHAHGLQPGDFLQQLRGGEHHAIADVAGGPGPHDSTGNQVQRGFLPVDDQGMPGIVPAVKAYDRIGRFAQPVHQFAFSFIAPLGAHHDDVAAFGRPALIVVHAAKILPKTENSFIGDSDGLEQPASVLPGQHPVAHKFFRRMLLAGQGNGHRFPLASQGLYGFLPAG